MAERDPQIGRKRAVASYAADYSAWISAQAMLLREGRYGDLDLPNLIDEVESLGRSDFASFVSAIEIVLIHMLKWDVQPTKRTPSWVASIEEHRRRVAQSLEDNPSYKSRILEALTRAWRTAPARAAAETNMPIAAFPTDNPFDWAAIISRQHQLPD